MDVEKIKVIFDSDFSKLKKGAKEADKIVRGIRGKVEGEKVGKGIGKDIGKGMSKGIGSSKTQIFNKLNGIFSKMRTVSAYGSALITAPLMGVGTAALAMTKKSGEAADRLLDLHDITDMSTDNLQKWQYVAKGAGVNVETMSNSIKGLTKRLKQADKEGSNFSTALQKLNINYKNLSTLDMDTQVDILMSELSDMENVTERNAIASELFGNAWEDLAPILGAGSKKIAKTKEDAEKLGNIIKNEDLQKLNSFRKEWDLLKLKMSYVSMEIATNLAPVFESTIIPLMYQGAEMVSRFAEKIEAIGPEAFQGILFGATAFALLFPAIGTVANLATGVMFLTQQAIAFSTAIQGLNLSFSALLGPVLLAVAAFTLFMGVLWKTEDESTIVANTIGEKFHALGQRLLGVMNFVGAISSSIVGITVNSIITLIQKSMNKVNNFLEGMKGLSNSLGLDWLSDKLGSGISSIDGAINKLNKVKSSVSDAYTSLLDDAMYKMDKPFDAYMDKQFKKGKINIETEVGGKKVSILESEALDDKGRIKEKYRKMIEEQRQESRKNKFKMPDFEDIKMPKFDDFNFPEIPETPEIETPDLKSLKDTAKGTDLVAEAMKKMGEEFEQATKKIKDSIGMFDGFRTKTTSAYRLLRNAKQRAKAINEREQTLNSLQNKGLSSELMAELQDTDINDLGHLKGLNRMNKEQLQQWVALQHSADLSAERQAMNKVITIESININANDKDFNEVEKELYRRLRVKGVTI